MGNKDINNDEYKRNFDEVDKMDDYKLLRKKIYLDYQEKNEKIKRRKDKKFFDPDPITSRTTKRKERIEKRK